MTYPLFLNNTVGEVVVVDVGVDEAGRGCVCGPMVYCALFAVRDSPGLKGVKGLWKKFTPDSKDLTPQARTTLFRSILFVQFS